jgi:predicted outer membrane protein
MASAMLSAAVAGPALGAANGGDQEIVSQLHLAAQLSIEMANLGEARASNAKIKQLASRMAADHRVADLKLLTYAELRQMDMGFIGRPGAVIPAHDALALAEIEQTPEQRFDYDFVSRVIANHEAIIDEADAARGIARDPLLKSLIDGELPMMRQHLAEARSVLASLPEPTPAPIVPVP